MPFVQRNAHGEIETLVKEPTLATQEFLAPNHPEVITFLCAGAPEGDNQFTPLADLEMIRVIEDLVDILISKNVIVLTDLPAAVQQKLLRQQSRRARLFQGVSIDMDSGGPLF